MMRVSLLLTIGICWTISSSSSFLDVNSISVVLVWWKAPFKSSFLLFY
jgi:hypothetical protein